MNVGRFVSQVFERLGWRRRGVATSKQTPVARRPPTYLYPTAAELSPEDPERLPAIIERLAGYGIRHCTLVMNETCDRADFLAAAQLAAEAGMAVHVRGRASELGQRGMLEELANAGAAEVECLFLASIDEIHDALAGPGDCRFAKALFNQSLHGLQYRALLPLVPNVVHTLDRTLDFLADNKVRNISVFAVVCPDDEPSSWALSIVTLAHVLQKLDALNKKNAHGIVFNYYPLQRFKPTQSLAGQIRRGPRCHWNAVRVDNDGRVYAPVGPAKVVLDLLQEDGNLPEGSPNTLSIQLPDIQVSCDNCRSDNCQSGAICEHGCFRDPASWCC